MWPQLDAWVHSQEKKISAHIAASRCRGQTWSSVSVSLISVNTTRAATCKENTYGAATLLWFRFFRPSHLGFQTITSGLGQAELDVRSRGIPNPLAKPQPEAAGPHAPARRRQRRGSHCRPAESQGHSQDLLLERHCRTQPAKGGFALNVPRDRAGTAAAQAANAAPCANATPRRDRHPSAAPGTTTDLHPPGTKPLMIIVIIVPKEPSRTQALPAPLPTSKPPLHGWVCHCKQK